jgi:GSH-dependent disulfide-bond oxidoreductase
VAERLYGVLDERLGNREFISGGYTIADMAAYPWIVPYERQAMKLDDLPNLKRWFEAIRRRPAVQRAYAKERAINTRPMLDNEAKRILFGQGRRR